MSIQERLQLILKMHNLTPSAFADKLGVQRSNVSHVLSGRNKPGLDFLEKIIINFPRVNAHWLLTGKLHDERSSDEMQPETPQSKPLKTVLIEEEGEDPILLKIVEFYSDGTFMEFHPKKQ